MKRFKVTFRKRRFSRWALLVSGLSAALVVLVVAGVWLFLHNRASDELAANRQAALTVAQQVATDLTSLGADNAQERIDSLSRNSTGRFHGEISTYGAVLQSLLQQAGAGSRGTVSASAVERIDDSSASILVTVAATVSNNRQPDPQPFSYRLVVELKKEGDRWLASAVNFAA